MMYLGIVTPGRVEVIEDVVRIRLDAPDGSRGVLSGHERSRVVLEPGPVEVVRDQEVTTFIATEGGVAWIEPRGVELVSTWATRAHDLASLAKMVARRAQFRRDVEAQARLVARRHELATQRALAGLRREVSQ